METPAGKPSALKRFCRKALFVLAALITLGALLVAEEDWRGSRAWENYKRALEAKGERFDAARLIPPKVPNDQNFAMTPYFAANLELSPEMLRQPIDVNPASTTNVSSPDGGKVMPLVNLNSNILAQFSLPDPDNLPRRFTWSYGMAGDLTLWAAAFAETNAVGDPAKMRDLRTRAINGLTRADPDASIAKMDDAVQAATFILDKMKPLAAALAQLQTDSARSYCRFNILYEDFTNPQVTSAALGHLADIKRLCRILTLRSEAEMVAGHADQALKDILLLFRVDDGLGDEPLIISELVRYASTVILLQSVGQGLAEHRWNEAQLQALQERLQKTDLIASTVRALYGERDLLANAKFDQGYMWPRGWDRLEQLNLNRAYEDIVLPRFDLAAHEISPGVNHSMDLAFQKFSDGSAFLHHSIFATRLLPAIARVPQKTAFAQCGVDLAMLACALERYRLAQGQYPEDLNALVPRFVAVLPHDLINGQPLHYRRAEGERFVLYSVGWNEKDDGGVVSLNKEKPPRQDTMRGDWVWQYPAGN